MHNHTAAGRRLDVSSFAQVGVAALLSVFMGAAQAGNATGSGIEFTDHDPNIWSFGGTVQVCVMCHAPHASATTAVAGLLWNHALSTAGSYTLYSSSTMNAVVGQPGPTSKLCLSCHDGTVGIMDFGGATGGMSLGDLYGTPQGPYLGTTLNRNHPIGITYDAALASADGALVDPTTTDVTIGTSPSKTGKISAVMLVGGKIECNTCHDVHNKFTVGATYKGLLKVGIAGSALCLKCHTK